MAAIKEAKAIAGALMANVAFAEQTERYEDMAKVL